jgi:hypothetical protein
MIRADFNGVPSAEATTRPETIHRGGIFSLGFEGAIAELWRSRITAAWKIDNIIAATFVS